MGLDNDSSLYIPSSTQNWTNKNGKRIAGITALGIGGTNVHMIISENIEIKEDIQTPNQSLLIIPFSAKTNEALKDQIKQFKQYYIKNYNNLSLTDIAYTLQNGRYAHQFRMTFNVNDKKDLLNKIDGYLESDNTFNNHPSNDKNKRKKLVFMFPGQGSQFHYMGQSLYQKCSVFKEYLDECVSLVRKEIDVNLLEIIFSDSDHLFSTNISQPAIFSIEYALAKTFMYFDIVPNALIGHSLGEYVAACIAGCISLTDAIKLVIYRGKLIQTLPEGKMLAVFANFEEIKAIIPETIDVAAINSTNMLTLSGSIEDIYDFNKQLAIKNIQSKVLKVSKAFHSRYLDPILSKFKDILQSIKLKKPDIPWVSNVTKNWIEDNEAMNPDYWVKHLRETVMFSDSIKCLLNDDFFHFIEVGPGKSLVSFVKQTCNDAIYTHYTLTNSSNTALAKFDIHNTIADIWCAGYPINWSKIYPDVTAKKIALPGYPFQLSEFNLLIRNDCSQRTNKSNKKTTSTNKVSINLNSEEVINSLFTKYLGIDVDKDKHFFECGGHSLLAVEFLDELNNKFNINITLSEFISNDSQSKLVEFIEQSNNSKSCLIKLANNDTENGKVLFLIHPIGGDLLAYSTLAKQLTAFDQVYGIQDPRLISKSSTAITITDKAKYYLDLIDKNSNLKHYHLGGWSFGGFLAYHMHYLLAQRGTSGSLFMIDPAPPNIASQLTRKNINQEYLIKEIARQCNSYNEIELKKLLMPSPNQETKINANIAQINYLNLLKDVYLQNYQTLKNYSPPSEKLSVKTMIYTASQNEVWSKKINWDKYFNKKQIIHHALEADHYSIMEKHNISTISQSINKFL